MVNKDGNWDLPTYSEFFDKLKETFVSKYSAEFRPRTSSLKFLKTNMASFIYKLCVCFPGIQVRQTKNEGRSKTPCEREMANI